MSVDCTNCKFAKWRVTAANRLHPSGDGRCTWTYPEIAIPKALFWFSGPNKPNGGHIDRRSPHTDCPTWERKA